MKMKKLWSALAVSALFLSVFCPSFFAGNPRWNENEDNALRRAVEAFGCDDWTAVAEEVARLAPNDPVRTANGCHERWYNYVRQIAQDKVVNRDRFTPEEDARLRHEVEVNGAQNWNAVAQRLNTGRSWKQCSERWVNYLSPSTNNGPWTAEEDTVLVDMQNWSG
jgi:hypothetical protein